MSFDNWTRCGLVKKLLCNRWEIHPTGKIRKHRTKKLIKPLIDYGGYPILVWRSKKKQCILSLHRISLETFFPKPHPILECDHRDENRKNYAINNLRWVTHSLNISFQKHKGWMAVKNKNYVSYRSRFRDKSSFFKTKEEAREYYLTQRALWQKNEREKIISLVMNHNKIPREQAICALNWDERDFPDNNSCLKDPKPNVNS